MILFGYLFAFWVIPHLITVVPNFKSIGPWLGLCESLGVLSGAWLLCCICRLYRGHDSATQWFPQRLWLACATGAAHAAAGLGMVLGIYPRLAAILEALMMSAFVIMLHILSLWTQPPPAWGPTLRTELTPLFWATALAASAWLVARSYP